MCTGSMLRTPSHPLGVEADAPCKEEAGFVPRLGLVGWVERRVNHGELDEVARADEDRNDHVLKHEAQEVSHSPGGDAWRWPEEARVSTGKAAGKRMGILKLECIVRLVASLG